MPASAPAPYVGYVLPDRQRAVLARITELETQQGRLFAARMLAVYDQSRLWEQAPGPDMFGILELAGTARVGQSRAAILQDDARRLVEVLRGTLEALQAGSIFQPAAELLLRLTRHCTAEVAARVERRVLPYLTGNTADLRRLLAETILQAEVDLDPDGLAERERLARERRGVWIRPTLDGICQIGADLDDLTGRWWSLEFEELVRAQKAADQAAGVKRSASQRRADVFANLPGQLRALLHAIRSGDLEVLQGLTRQDAQSAEDLEQFADHVSDLLQPDPDPAPEPAPVPAHEPEPEPERDAQSTADGTAPSRPVTDADLLRALMLLPVRDPRTLLVHVPMATLLDLDQRCGWIEGVGPISPRRVRLMLATAGLRRVITDPRSGIPQHLDRKTEPPPDLFDPDDPNDPEASTRAAEHVRARLLAMLQPTLIEEHASTAHDPTAAVGELVDLRDQRCTGIGCNHPAHLCDRDHEVLLRKCTSPGL